MSEPTLEQVREAFYAEFAKVPFHRRIGLLLERESSEGRPRITLPASRGGDGIHSAAAVYTLADAAAAIEICEAVAPRALKLGLGAVFFSVSGGLKLLGPARGTIAAGGEVLEGLDPSAGLPGRSRKATLEVGVSVLGGEGEPVAEQRSSFYVRFMDRSRMAGVFRPESEVSRLAAE